MRGGDAASGPRAERFRAGILAAAESLFAARGIGRTRLRDVAARAGIERAAVAQHFGRKDDLRAAVLAELLADLRSRYSRALISPASHARRFERLVQTWTTFCLERPAFLRLLVHELDEGAGLASREIAQQIASVLEPVRAVIRAGREAGAFRAADATHVIFALAGVSVFLLIGAPALVPDEYPQGLEPLHGERVHAELVRLGRVLLGAPRPPLGRGEPRR